ncbi:MAG TPA: hypothetical protein VG796_14830 [Verrucomicrobiales bacterium]|nr:hypothetical protein [Verrucomicrobiales bacterium]
MTPNPGKLGKLRLFFGWMLLLVSAAIWPIALIASFPGLAAGRNTAGVLFVIAIVSLVAGLAMTNHENGFADSERLFSIFNRHQHPGMS